MPFVSVKNGKIHSAKLEYNLAEHCNFSCDECSHLSPYMPVRYADLEVFRRDLKALNEVYHVGRFRFVGGEPFLNKDILRFIQTVRELGFADKIQICSNGSLIQKVDEEVFRQIDMLSISWYPDDRMDQQKVDYAREMCEKHGVEFKLEKIERFRAMQLDEPIRDPALLDEVYRTCQIAHSWYCQTVYEGYFYLCSRPLFTNAYLAQKGLKAPDYRKIDGIPLHAPDLLGRLKTYLESPTPIASCAYCLGSVGKYVPWKQLNLAERRTTQTLPRRAEDSIDRARMRYLDRVTRVERRVLKLVPSLRLARALGMVKNGPIQD